MSLLTEFVYQKYGQGKGTLTTEDVQNIYNAQRFINEYLVSKYFPSNRHSVIFDLGAGLGSLIEYASKKGYVNVFGVDKSKDQTSCAAKVSTLILEGDAIEFIKGLENESVDLFILNDLLEHLEDHDIYLLLKIMRQKLRITGRVLIHTNNGAAPCFGLIRYGDITHKRAFTQDSFIQLQRTFEYTSSDVYEVRPIVHGIKSALRYIFWLVGALFIKIFVAAETGRAIREIKISNNIVCILNK